MSLEEKLDKFQKEFDDFSKKNSEEHEEIKGMIKDLRKEFRGLIEIQKRLIHERLGVPIPPPSNEYAQPEGKKPSSIEIKNYGDGRISIQGNTYEYNSAIKEAASSNGEKARWEPAPQKLWHVSDKCLSSLIENFRNVGLEEGKDFTVNVKTDEDKDNEKDNLKDNLNNDDNQDSNDGGFGSGFV